MFQNCAEIFDRFRSRHFSTTLNSQQTHTFRKFKQKLFSFPSFNKKVFNLLFVREQSSHLDLELFFDVQAGKVCLFETELSGSVRSGAFGIFGIVTGFGIGVGTGAINVEGNRFGTPVVCGFSCLSKKFSFFDGK